MSKPAIGCELARFSTGYDGYARLTSYGQSGTVSLTHIYNGLDDRTATTTTPSGGVADTRRFVTDTTGRVLGEYGTSATDVRAEFIWMAPAANDNGAPFGGDDGIGGYAPIAVATATATPGVAVLSWVHSDHLGTPIAMTDATGTAIAQPTGYTTPAFPGQSKTLADLYYNRYRDYDPTTGRYVQADPIGLAGGSNPYLYAEGNPVRYVDPLGLEAPCITLNIGCWGPKGDPETLKREGRAGTAMTVVAVAGSIAVAWEYIVPASSRFIKDCSFYGPSSRNKRIFGIRYKKKYNVFRVDYHTYPGTNGRKRLHGHGPNENVHLPLDPRSFFD